MHSAPSPRPVLSDAGAGTDTEEGEVPPFVSVIIPCLQEERFIRGSLRALLDGTYPPERMEVLVVDGRSRDRTRDIVTEIAVRDVRVKLLDNPAGATPAALNIGLRAARGTVIVRADAHSDYPPDYVATLVRTLEETGADMVGAREESVPADESTMCQAITLAIKNPIATGSPYRYRNTSGAIDAVTFGCWRRELFDRVGVFDERLLRNQDNEHSSRILRAGGVVYMTTEVRVRYYNRSTLGKLWKQASTTGMWNAFTQTLYPYTFRWRHFLPGPFFVGVLGALALIALGLASPRPLGLVDGRVLVALGAAGLAPYLATVLAVSTWIAIRNRRPLILFAPLIAFVMASFHLAYGYGITRGWLLVATGRWRDRLGKVATPPEPAKRSREVTAK